MARDLADATDISEFLVPGSLTNIAKIGTVVPRTHEQIAGDQMLGEVLTRYEVPISVFQYEPTPDPHDDIWSGAHIVWMYSGGRCIGSLQLIDGEWQQFPLTLLWEGDQA